MKKRLITCMLAFTMLFTAMPVNAAEDSEPAALFGSFQGEQDPEGISGYVKDFDDGSDAGYSAESGWVFTDGNSSEVQNIEEAEEAPLLSASQYVVPILKLPIPGQPGQYDDTADLSGLIFTLYETDGNTPENLVYKDSAMSSYDTYNSLYKVFFQGLGDTSKAYKIILQDNPFYEMTDSYLFSVGSYVPSGTLELVKKAPVSDGSTSVVVDGMPGAVWTGTGAENDPYAITQTVSTNTSTITVRTENTQAAISYEGNTYTGKNIFNIPYGTNTVSFTVTSKDGNKTSYYSAEITRPKYKPLAPSNLKGISPATIGGSDGEITGLDTKKAYEYKMAGESDYIPVNAGAAKIEGLAEGTYAVRLAETDTQAPSPDANVVVPAPVVHTIKPPANLPQGVEILEIPNEMVEGRKMQIKIKLPPGRLIEAVNYKYVSGGWTLSSSFHSNDFSYSQENGENILTISTDAIDYDITLDISLKEGTYYQVTTAPEGTQYTVGVTGATKVRQGNLDYYQSGSNITVTAALKTIPSTWIGFAEISSLAAYKKGTEVPVEGTVLDTSSKNAWTLKISVNEDMNINHSVTIYPADFTELEEILNKIGSLNQYVNNKAKADLEERLKMLDAIRRQPKKDQETVNNYVDLLAEDYKGLVIYVPLPQPSPLDNMPPGSILLPDGSIQTPNGTIIKPDGTIILPDQTVLSPTEDGKKPSIDKQENVTDVNGTVIDGDGNITLPNTGTDPEEKQTSVNKAETGERPKYHPEDGTVTTSEGNTVVQPDGNRVQPPSGSVVQPDGTITYPDGTKVQPDGTIYGADGSIVGRDGTYARPARPVIERVEIKRNRADIYLEQETAGATGYDYVISPNPNCIVDKDYTQVNKNVLLTNTSMFYVQQDTYYAYCHSWLRDSNGRKVFSQWSEGYEFTVPGYTPDTPSIVKVANPKKGVVVVTVSVPEGAKGFDVILGRSIKKVNGEKRPVDYGKDVRKNQRSTLKTVTFKNVKPGRIYAALHSYSRTPETNAKVFSKWSGYKTIKVK
ncbi:hypothetical protein NXH76_21795 [Blautia schinkii]|nr:hypothetical protein [Blautia schinkii]